jgi:glutathione S-transferase
MALVVYGSAYSRTRRTLWLLAELGLTYAHVPVAWDDPWLKSPEFLRLNPAGAIPTIVDDGFALGESMAIQLYLAKKHGATGEDSLYPGGYQAEAAAWRWSLWAQGHLEPWVQRDARLAGFRDAVGDAARPLVASALSTLERAVEGDAWLVGDCFTVADLNVAGVLSPSRATHLDLTPWPQVMAWLARCYGRPAAREIRRRFGRP